MALNELPSISIWQRHWEGCSARPERDRREKWTLPYPIYATEASRVPQCITGPSTYIGWHGRFPQWALEEERHQHVNVKPSRFLMTIASTTESARLRGERVAALGPDRKTVSPVDRSALLEYLQKTLSEAAVPEMRKVCSFVEICHPKPQTLHPGEFNSRQLASPYLTCADAEAVWDWLGNDDVVKQRFEAYEARRRSVFY